MKIIDTRFLSGGSYGSNFRRKWASVWALVIITRSGLPVSSFFPALIKAGDYCLVLPTTFAISKCGGWETTPFHFKYPVRAKLLKFTINLGFVNYTLK